MKKINPYLKQAIILTVTTGISWLDLRLGIAIFVIKILWIFWQYHHD